MPRDADFGVGTGIPMAVPVPRLNSALGEATGIQVWANASEADCALLVFPWALTLSVEETPIAPTFQGERPSPLPVPTSYIYTSPMN